MVRRKRRIEATEENAPGGIAPGEAANTADQMAAMGVSDWRLCKGNPNYAVDANGNVYRVCREQKTKRGNIVRQHEVVKLQGSPDKYGYQTVRMLLGGEKKHVKAHRLVASAFLDDEENKSEVNHKNGVKNDNRVVNLEWNTRTENNRHAIDTGLLKFPTGGKCKNTKVFPWDYMSIFIMAKHAGISRQGIAEMNRVSRQTIDNIVNRVGNLLAEAGI